MRKDYRIAAVASALWFAGWFTFGPLYSTRGEELIHFALGGIAIIWIAAAGRRWINGS